MKKFFFVFGLLATLAVAAYAAEVRVQVTFSYNNTDPQYELDGVRLYMDGAEFCSLTAAQITGTTDASQYECAKDVDPGLHAFTMTVLRANGSESPPAATYYHTIGSSIPGQPPQPPVPVVIEFKIFVNGVEYTVSPN